MNGLANERSAYLRHAAHQKIEWHPWSDEAFEKARSADKPLFLSTGAVWCHWCHVMAKESFEDEEIATLLNEHYISIKLDRDERPDIDRRYQQAVSAMGAGGGWPLSVFLTPDRRAFFGGTYFPPEDRHGRPGFKSVLTAVSDYYRAKRGEVTDYAQRVMDTLKPETPASGSVTASMVDEAVQEILSQADARNGGFGTQPKFPMPGAVEFLVRRAFLRNDPTAGEVVRKTLGAMARGGFHDQLAGGFHRYSVDEAWIIPHFEKMADDNAWLLRNYVDAYAVFNDVRFREAADGIVRYTKEVLADPEGGFYASQDADVTPDDEGGYFTWTDEDFRSVLDDEEHPILSLHFFHERGSMHHDPSKKVLVQALSSGEIAEKLGKDPGDVSGIIEQGKAKLLDARGKRETPFVDRTLYTSLNGMYITSFLRAFRILGDDWAGEFALKSLERILRERFIDSILYHSEGVVALLDDHVHLIDALIAAYEVTAEDRYLKQAAEGMDVCRERFYDHELGGFYDTEKEVLGTRLKRIEDIPHPSANAVAIMLLLRLFSMTGNEEYQQAAEQSLSAFSGAAREMGVHAGSYFNALQASFFMLKLSVEASPESDLARAARSLAGPYSAILYGENRDRVVPCIDRTCFEPIHDAGVLLDFAGSLRQHGGAE